MKKLALILAFSAGLLPVFGQQLLHLYNGNNIVFERAVTSIDSIKFNTYNSIFNYDNDFLIFPTSDIDSITFSTDTLLEDNSIYIVYNGNTVTITNPLADEGVSIDTNGADVSVVTTAGMTDINYHILGQTSDGSLSINSDKRFNLLMDGVSITNPDGPAILIQSGKKVSVMLTGGQVNTLVDGNGHSKKAAFQSKGQLIFNGSGELHVTGSTKHGIQSDDYVQINNGNIQVESAASDGVHCAYFIMNEGQLTIANVGGDGVDGDEGYIQVNGGTVNITVPTADTKGMKCDSTIEISGGAITLTVSGDQSKGFKSGKDMIINNGLINITASGNVVLEESGSGYDPSYCTAIKSDAQIIIRGGNTTINCTSTNKGGKGLSADSTIIISDGYLTITTAGAGATYTNESGVTDSYTAACIKGDYDVFLLGGTINCSSSGSGGKGINVDSALTIGRLGDEDGSLSLTVSTSGERFYVSGTGTGGGGGWPGGGGGDPDDNNDYANPKAIKSLGNMTVNSGTIVVTCTQTQEGGEGMESKDTLTINGGNISISAYDDCINAANYIRINGGTTYCVSSGNDAIDCNGPMSMSGGFVIANGTGAPEGGFDCDQYTFTITGGTAIGTGGENSSNFAGGQKVVKYSGSSNRAIQIINSNNEVICTYQIPNISGGGPGGGPGGGGPGGGGPGGSSSASMLFTSPLLSAGTYTLKYGGTISGGTNYHGYYTGATYSGGSSKSFTIGSSQSTTVSVN